MYGREVEPLQLWDRGDLARARPLSVSSGDTVTSLEGGLSFDLQDGLAQGDRVGVWVGDDMMVVQGFLVAVIAFPKAAAESFTCVFVYPFSF